MKKNFNPEKIDVLLLCGGKGERLKDLVKDRPKPMADIKGRPFLDILINYILNFGFLRIILCLGYKGEIVSQYYNEKSRFFNILFSQESKPLGTAGAIKNAEHLVESNPFLVMNGDSFCPLDLFELINFHNEKKAAFTMALVKSVGDKDYGVVGVDKSQKIISFNEKVKIKNNGFVNAGIYLLEKKIFDLIETGTKLSLEYDIFPRILSERFYGYITKEKLIDIGTPERYAKAKKMFKRCRLKE